jgi:hypothetical protein
MSTRMRRTENTSNGHLVILILVFGSIFLLLLASFLGLFVSQKRASGTAVASERALHIAEAGLEYYRWYLAHNPGDITNGTTTPQPYIHRYTDPQTGEIGQFELTVEGTNASCGQVGAIEITSVGYTDNDPDLKRVVRGRYARPIVSEYSYVLNAPYTWIGADHEITGPYHSNGTLEMDGTNNSIMTSARENGIYGDGPNDDLWQFPVPPVDFVGISVDLVTMKTAAQTSGLHFGPSNKKGYHVLFKSNGTIEVRKVRSTHSMDAYRVDNSNEQTEDNLIQDRDSATTYTIPSDCAVLFFEDRVWVEGVLNKKVTLVAARPAHSSDPSIILPGNITYTTNNGSAGLLAIAEDDVLIALNSPEDMTINGIFVAQKGYFGRNGYALQGNSVPNGFSSYVKQDELTINGTIISNGRSATKWTCGGGFCSGYNYRESSYNRTLVESPPPLTPATSPDYQFVEWREEVEAP